MSFQKNIKCVLTFNSEGLVELLNDENATYQAIFLVILRAIVAGMGAILLGLVDPEFDFPENVFIFATRVTLARVLLLLLFLVVFAYILVFSLNKLGGTLITVHSARIIGLTFVFDLIYDIISMSIRIIYIDNNLPWYVLVYIPTIFTIVAIVIAFSSYTKVPGRDILIATIVSYIVSNIGSAILFFTTLAIFLGL